MENWAEVIHVALYKPEIHPNAGNIARLCAANGLPLHFVGNLGFRIDERSVRRAGLDYWPFVDLHREADLEELKSGSSRIPSVLFQRPGGPSLYGRGIPSGGLPCIWPRIQRFSRRAAAREPRARFKNSYADCQCAQPESRDGRGHRRLRSPAPAFAEN